MKTQIKVDLTEPQKKYLRVSYVMTGVAKTGLVMTFPTWSPGSYLIREYSSQVEYLQAKTGRGHALTIKKINKCQWRIAPSPDGQVVLNYALYAGDLNVRAAYADHELVFFNTPAVFFHPEGHLSEPVNLKITTPKTWSLVLAKKDQAGVFKFNDFDELYDTPILAAQNMVIKTGRVRDTRYTFAFYGVYEKDLDKIVHDASLILGEQIKMFHSHPCTHYVFQILSLPGGYGGLEHRASSTHIFDGLKLNERKEYLKFLSLLSHEHFHLWNVKRIRPRALGPFDYTHENYTRELWIAEGITSYYDDHFVLRAGLCQPDEYLKIVSENLSRLLINKAARVNSLSESSFDAWIRFYRPNENTLNTTVSYYLKGGLIMMYLDWLIILATRGQKNLDHVMKELYHLYQKRPQKGITREEFFAVVERVSRRPFSGFVEKYIDGVASLNWAQAFKSVGIHCTEKKEDKKNYLGLILTKKGEKIIVQNVAEDSPAFHSILQPQDEVLALDDERLESEKNLDRFLRRKSLKVLFSRRGKVSEVTISLSAKKQGEISLSLMKKVNPTQKRARQIFLER